MKTDDVFTYRSYTKTELATMGYNKFRHTLLRKEVEAIVKYLGEP